MRTLLELVNEVPKIIPKRIGEVAEMSAAIAYSNTDEEPLVVHLGTPEDLLTAFPHEGIAEDEAPVGFRRISAVTLINNSGIYLALDIDRVKRHGGLERFKKDLGDDYDEVFLGGYSEEDFPTGLGSETLCTTGLIREASKFQRLGAINRMSYGQTKLALSLSISQLAMGIPMPEQMTIEMAKSEDI